VIFGPSIRRQQVGLLSVATVVLLIADAWDQQVSSVWLAGPLDETAHALTALLFIWAAGGALDRMAVPILVASVAIDLDHLPGDFGARWLTAGDPRPYPHCLLAIAIVLMLAWRVARWRLCLCGVAVGLTIHLWRDLAEPGSGVGLLWPASSASFSLPHAFYLAVMALVVVSASRASNEQFWLVGRRRKTLETGLVTAIGARPALRKSDRRELFCSGGMSLRRDDGTGAPGVAPSSAADALRAEGESAPRET
jgi:hypothetical protein